MSSTAADRLESIYIEQQRLPKNRRLTFADDLAEAVIALRAMARLKAELSATRGGCPRCGRTETRAKSRGKMSPDGYSGISADWILEDEEIDPQAGGIAADLRTTADLLDAARNREG